MTRLLRSSSAHSRRASVGGALTIKEGKLRSASSPLTSSSGSMLTITDGMLVTRRAAHAKHNVGQGDRQRR